ncbi:hypothetical protein DMENIID0001_142100 [Sergentomyia squamirostris]
MGDEIIGHEAVQYCGQIFAITLTNWEFFREVLDDRISLNIPLKNPEDIEAATEFITSAIQYASWSATPEKIVKGSKQFCPGNIKRMIADKRRLRRKWQKTRSRGDKTAFNVAVKELKRAMTAASNASLETYLSRLDPSNTSDYNLWKATRYLKHQQHSVPPVRSVDGDWLRTDQEKAYAFANHLQKVFTPWETGDSPPSMVRAYEEVDSPLKLFSPSETKFHEEARVVVYFER